MSAKLILEIPESDDLPQKNLPEVEAGDENELGRLRALPKDSKNNILELGDLLDAAAGALRTHIKERSILRLEVRGTITSSAKAGIGANVYVFNIGGEGKKEREDSVTITLETPIEPEN